MPIEIKELHIKVAVDGSRMAPTATTGGDEALRTRFGGNDADDPDPLGGDALLVPLMIDDGTAVLVDPGASSQHWASGSDW